MIRSTLEIVERRQFQSVAFPLIGSGSGNRGKKFAQEIILDELSRLDSKAKVVVVQFPAKQRSLKKK